MVSRNDYESQLS